MRFSRDGEWHQVTRIMGPCHNFLALKFDRDGTSELVIERLSISNDAPGIETDDVQSQVVEGVIEANADFGTSYQVPAICFVVTDTPLSDIYRALAKAIVAQAEAA